MASDVHHLTRGPWNEPRKITDLSNDELHSLLWGADPDLPIDRPITPIAREKLCYDAIAEINRRKQPS
jgi:hypothetical protein